jgi:hypothetical protein
LLTCNLSRGAQNRVGADVLPIERVMVTDVRFSLPQLGRELIKG